MINSVILSGRSIVSKPAVGLGRKIQFPKGIVPLSKKKLFTSDLPTIRQHAENYVKPEQESFTSLKDMLRYAKERIVAALKSISPHEYSVGGDMKTKRIIAEHRGNSKSVRSGYYDNIKCDISMHGHPTRVVLDGKKVTTPISLQDAFSLSFLPSHKQEIAFNELGEYSLLKKKPRFVPLTPEREKYYKKLYTEHLGQAKASSSMPKEIMDILRQYMPEEFSNVSTAAEVYQKCKTINIKEKIPKEKLEEICRIIENHEPEVDIRKIRAIHEFWKKYADEMGFIYRTNYSCF